MKNTRNPISSHVSSFSIAPQNEYRFHPNQKYLKENVSYGLAIPNLFRANKDHKGHEPSKVAHPRLLNHGKPFLNTRHGNSEPVHNENESPIQKKKNVFGQAKQNSAAPLYTPDQTISDLDMNRLAASVNTISNFDLRRNSESLVKPLNQATSTVEPRAKSPIFFKIDNDPRKMHNASHRMNIPTYGIEKIVDMKRVKIP